MKDSISCPDILTVVIRDDSPMIFCGDSPSYRSVQIRLTNEQKSSLNLVEYESFSSCWIEPLQKIEKVKEFNPDTIRRTKS